jgi:integrase
MRGSIARYCSCVDPQSGKRLGSSCPKLTSSRHGRFQFVVDVPSVGGVRRQMRRGGFRTKGDAERARDLTLQRLRGGWVTDDKSTLAEWLDYWLSEKSKTAGGSAAGRSIRPSTAMAYRSHVDLYLKPRLGAIRLSELTPQHISNAYDAIAARPGRPKPGADTMSAANLRRVHATLKSSLSAAVRARRISLNPATLVDLPAARRPKVRPWEPAEVGRFLDAAASHRLGSLFEVMALTGLRRGEALGLRWSDVDLVAGVVVVRQQLVQVGSSLQFGPPKTASGEHRLVELDLRAVGTLLAHRLHQDEDRTAWGAAYVDAGLVFARDDGRPIAPDTASKTFKRLVAKAKLRDIRLHDLRHGQASLMLAAGVPMAVVSKRLGHSTITITSDTYSHLLEGVGRDAAQKASDLIPRAARDTDVTPNMEVGTNGTAGSPAVPEISGGPPGARTRNLRIKSPQL